ncbi:leucine-rich repeat-containing protein 7-like [Dendronephthya gigantea]|uniref:leucine-rich repeat-containing protein 7-like n=1 Tax=Dendronephthya gigantea TaxID=151771 RepID=UPI00106BA1C5|nr:leucine-rich repeat-containing protein 7-like [Dendronephthya gigantea]
MDCDVSDVAKNISKHLVEFCQVEIPNNSQPKEIILLVTDLDAPGAASPLSRNGHHVTRKGENHGDNKRFEVLKLSSGATSQIEVTVYRNPGLGFTIGGGANSGSHEGIYVVSVNPDGPSSHLLRAGDRILEVNEINLRCVSHEHAVLFLTHNQQLDLLIERVVQ